MILFGAFFKKIVLKFLCLLMKIKPTHLLVCFDFKVKHLKSSIVWNYSKRHVYFANCFIIFTFQHISCWNNTMQYLIKNFRITQLHHFMWLRGTLLLLRLSRFSCVHLYATLDCSPPGSSVHRILQAKNILEWIVMPSRRKEVCYKSLN